jgi:glucokinase
MTARKIKQDLPVIGVDVGGTNVRAGKVLGLELVKHASRRISAKEAEEVVLKEIEDTIEQVFDDSVKGIGVGVPSLVDVQKGIVYTVENIPSWQKVYLKDRLEKTFNVPVYVNNDANCFALGECYFGKGRGYRDIVALTIGTGMGAGIIIDHKLYNGANCGAGEFGNIHYKEKNLEYYCSGQRFQREYGVGGQVLCQRAQEGDAEALNIFDALGRDIGVAVQTVLYALDPEIIIFGGSVSNAFAFFEKALKESLRNYDYQHALESLVLARSEEKNIPILGAAALYFDAHQ